MIAAQRKLQVPPKRKGLTRLWFALNHSLSGMQIAAKEPAVRLELATAAVLVPAAFWVGKGPVEQVLLLASVVAVLVVEVLNTAIEAAIDRVGAEYHPLSKAAKDLGSAAVLLAIAMACATWGIIGLSHGA
ncbi:diacylglycerol kinase [Comamonas endophytica]|uniref:Diacylglycerol kinase n=1 Tax=Comamonas endophytica TaxID=2949090 RepID=A0ABY6GFH4_9BURK|nr:MULTISPECIES: diacylglycerol kinase [unclassified Acidovorax]MCD2513369.1 diacylglycerol kinase [Acidovorax sp. D4N7]UYG53848.1 diacylglycerol kinase [Acidovorax sp. 5MLIR]